MFRGLLNIVTGRRAHWNKYQLGVYDELTERIENTFDSEGALLATMIAGSASIIDLLLSPENHRPILRVPVKKVFRVQFVQLHSVLVCSLFAGSHTELGRKFGDTPFSQSFESVFGFDFRREDFYKGFCKKLCSDSVSEAPVYLLARLSEIASEPRNHDFALLMTQQVQFTAVFRLMASEIPKSYMALNETLNGGTDVSV